MHATVHDTYQLLHSEYNQQPLFDYATVDEPPPLLVPPQPTLPEPLPDAVKPTVSIEECSPYHRLLL